MELDYVLWRDGYAVPPNRRSYWTNEKQANIAVTEGRDPDPTISDVPETEDAEPVEGTPPDVEEAPEPENDEVKEDA